MIRGLYTSGWSMLANNRKMDVISNNLANVNTTGFKKDTVVFESFDSVLTMNEWEEILNTDDFYRVHKAYIVNMEFVEEIGRYILLDNGEKVELSVRKAAKFKKACKEYRKRNAR